MSGQIRLGMVISGFTRLDILCQVRSC